MSTATTWKYQSQEKPEVQASQSNFPPHPIQLYESCNMAAVQLPQLPQQALLHPDMQMLATSGFLSEAQHEAACYIKRAINYTPGKSFFLGDATGVGKTRTAMAVAYDRMLSSCPVAVDAEGPTRRFRMVWVSCRAGLEQCVQDTLRELHDKCGQAAPSYEWFSSNKTGRKRSHRETTAKQRPSIEVYFATYGALRQLLPTKSRPVPLLATITEWLHDSTDSLIVFDEAHLARTTNSATQRAVVQLQHQASQSAVLYLTATAASDVNNLAYMQRLGLYGQVDSPFSSFQRCREALKHADIGALELVAMHLKSKGLYISRTFSSTEAMFGNKVVCMQHAPIQLNITAEQQRLYDACCRKWWDIQKPHQESVGAGIHTSMKQNFFLRLLLSFKARLVIPHVKTAIAEGYAVIISLQSTGVSGVSKCAKTFESLDAQLQGFTLPPDALDILYLELSKLCGVSEITGRTSRMEHDHGNFARRARGMSQVQEDVARFQSSESLVALVSAAGGFGLSLHATAQESRPRLHLLLELPWGSEALVQQMGRSHRTGEAYPPVYRIVTIDVPCDQRVAYTVSRKMQALSALTRGDREELNSIDSHFNQLESAVLTASSLEILMREATHRLQRKPNVANLSTRERRAYARIHLGIGTGWQHSLICDRANRQLCTALDALDREDRRCEYQEDYERNLTVTARAIDVWQACEFMFPTISHLITRGCQIKQLSLLPPRTRGKVEYVMRCASTASASQSLGRLPKDTLERILNHVVEPGWLLTTQEFQLNMANNNIPRSSLTNKDKLFPRLPGTTVATQRTWWNVTQRASVEYCAPNSSAKKKRTMSIVDYVFPYGVPLGCKCVCTATASAEEAGHWLLDLRLQVIPDACARSRQAFELALAACTKEPPSRPMRVIPQSPFLCFTQGTNSIRAVTIKSHKEASQHAWDIEIWSPGVVNPTYKLTDDQWPAWSSRYLQHGKVTTSATEFRKYWSDREDVLMAKRYERCSHSKREVIVSDASRALHDWDESSQTIVKAEPPLVDVALIGVAMT